jgi:hypothetical protein
MLSPDSAPDRHPKRPVQIWMMLIMAAVFSVVLVLAIIYAV